MLRKLLLIVVLFSVGVVAQNKSKSVGFTENKGQFIDQKQRPNPSVLYLLNTSGLNVQLKKNGFSYDVYETKKIPLKGDELLIREEIQKQEDKKGSVPDYSLEYVFHRMDIIFEGSNPNVELVAEEKSTDYDNFYTLKHAPEGILMVYKYQKVTYRNLYPDIDVVFFCT